jgi:hypothetical protein
VNEELEKCEQEKRRRKIGTVTLRVDEGKAVVDNKSIELYS